MRISLLTVGDELLIGQVLNSNVQWMSERLTETGWNVGTQMTVGDQSDEIKKAIDFLLPTSDAIIIGGGLGPTHDDLTLEALSERFSIPLEYDEEWMQQVAAFFAARNRVMSENNKKQGFLLKTANRIDNDCGTAAGQHFVQGKCDFFVVPGVPHEMKSMMDRYILPVLTAKNVGAQKILKQTLVTTGIGESALAERCNVFVQKIKALPNVTLAFLPSSTQVRLRLQMESDNTAYFEFLVEELRHLCKQDFVGFDPVTLEDVVMDHLKEKNETVAIAESCTGGLVAHRLTQISGASKVLRGSLVAYQTTIKSLELGISEKFISQHGIVSEDTAKAMAEAVRKKWKSTYGISTTGYLGPNGGDTFAKVGTVCIAVATEEQTLARTFTFENNRERGKERATQAVLDLLRRTF